MSNTSSIPWSENLWSLGLRYKDTPAVIDADEVLSYRGLSNQAHALAHHLATLGLPPNARIGVLLPNGVDAVIADYGVTLSGYCMVHLNPAYTEEELQWAHRIAPMSAIITDPALADKAASVGPPVFLCSALKEATPSTFLPPVPGEYESRVVFTSGTSGKPKAALYDHAHRWTAAIMLRATLPFAPGKDSQIILMTPYVHGASMLARAWLDSGGCVRILSGVNANEVRRILMEGKADALFAPPTVLSKLVDTFKGDRFPKVRCIFTGTQVLSIPLYNEAREIFGPCVRITYGKSENINPITVLDPQDTESLYTSADITLANGACVGHPAPGVEITISDTQEIIIRTQHAFSGYLTETGLIHHKTSDWHATGDLGYLDTSGRLWLVGRNSEIINTGGYKVHPDEVERALVGITSLKEVYVVGVPSAYWGQIIVCAYISESGDNVPSSDILDKLHSLAKYKQPRCFVSVRDFKKNAIGKINRKELLRYILENHELIDGPRPDLR